MNFELRNSDKNSCINLVIWYTILLNAWMKLDCAIYIDVTQLLHQPLHIYKIYKIYTFKH